MRDISTNEADVSVNLLTFQALINKKMTVFGGSQVRPNIHIQDMVRTYQHFIEHDELESGCYNAGFKIFQFWISLRRLKKRSFRNYNFRIKRSALI